jgi:ATP-dependent protease HslVU (ClpYQ) peptidase subunit
LDWNENQIIKTIIEYLKKWHLDDMLKHSALLMCIYNPFDL